MTLISVYNNKQNFFEIYIVIFFEKSKISYFLSIIFLIV